MESMPAPPVPAPSTRIHLEYDTPCRRCGYNLRGLMLDGQCPECGAPVDLSIQGDLLKFADPDWLAKVARGLTIILWMVIGGILMSIIGEVVGRLTAPVVTQLIDLVVSAISFYGVWLMTEPDPSGIGEDPLTARKVVRITLLIGMGGQLLAMVTKSAQGLPAGIDVLFAIGALVLGIAGLVGEFAKFIFYEKLARRVPDEQLARRASFLRWAYTISLSVVTLAGLVIALILAVAGTAATPIAVGLGCFVGLVVLALLVFGLMTLYMLIRLRQALLREKETARLIWAVGPDAA